MLTESHSVHLKHWGQEMGWARASSLCCRDCISPQHCPVPLAYWGAVKRAAPFVPHILIKTWFSWRRRLDVPHTSAKNSIRAVLCKAGRSVHAGRGKAGCQNPVCAALASALLLGKTAHTKSNPGLCKAYLPNASSKKRRETILIPSSLLHGPEIASGGTRCCMCNWVITTTFLPFLFLSCLKLMLWCVDS